MIEETLDIESLRKFTGPLLYESRLQPGDVILMRGGKLEGGVKGDIVREAISRGTSNRPASAFTHAALVIDNGSLLESDGTGVGPRILRTLGCTEQHETVAELRTNVRELEVYRHPRITEVDPEKVDRALERLKAEYYKEYPPIHELIGAITVNRIRELADALEPFLMKLDQSKNPGPFCSEVAVLFYEYIGLSVGESGKTSPEALAKSGLERREDLIIDPHGLKLYAFEQELGDVVSQRMEQGRKWGVEMGRHNAAMKEFIATGQVRMLLDQIETFKLAVTSERPRMSARIISDFRDMLELFTQEQPSVDTYGITLGKLRRSDARRWNLLRLKAFRRQLKEERNWIRRCKLRRRINQVVESHEFTSEVLDYVIEDAESRAASNASREST